MIACPVFIGGKWREVTEVEKTPVYNPSRGETIAEAPMCGAELVNEAVEAAAAAFPAWRDTPAVERARVFFRYRQLIEENFDRICASVSLEHGKTLAEARGSVYRGLENVEYACGVPTLLMGDTLENLARGVDCETMHQPLGVCVGITPFNFPAMVPMWMFPLAVACGNTFVLKPSEKVPLTVVMIIELLEKAGLPPGVLNLVHGAREAVDALLTHPKVRAISFVGSSPVAKYIYETGIKHGKRVQANGGAKNYIVVMPDADVPRTVEALSMAAFGCAGERCMAGSTAITVGAAAERLLPSLVEAARAIKVGPTDAVAQPDMGPVITAQHRDRVLSLVANGEREGAKVLADGRGLKVAGAPNGFYIGATIVDEVRDEMTIAREEIFGPVLNVMRMDDLDEAIAIANRSAYGNGAAIFTNSGNAAREFKQRVKAGMVGINVGVPATMAMFPFTGWDESFYGDLHIQGKEGVQFYTQQKVVTTRWLGEFLGNLIVVIPMILNAHAGTKYGIPFPVFCRASFGTIGANVPALMRAFVACGWFGIQTWIGGEAIYKILAVFVPTLGAPGAATMLGITLPEFVCFLFFWGINMLVVYKGIDSIRFLLNIKAPLWIVLGLLLLGWAYQNAGGFGPMLSQPSAFDSGQPKAGKFLGFFVPALTGMIGFWATLSLNIPDFSRYARTQRDQIVGQALGLPLTMALYAFIGVAVTSATTIIYGQTIWDPVDVLTHFKNPVVLIVAMLALCVATLATNIAANVVSPANDFANVAPRRISFRLGGLITGIIGILIVPWKLVADPSGYIFTWLVGYSALLGPIGGIMIADYFVIRRRQLDVAALYQEDGQYRFTNGFSIVAMVALCAAILPNLPGFLVNVKLIDAGSVPPFLIALYDYAWFAGFAIAFTLY